MSISCMTYSSWMQGKKEIAQALAQGECGGTYAEAAIILCAGISAMASFCWPRRDNDKARFIEVIVTFCSKTIDPTIISVPLLADKSELWRRRLPITSKSYWLTVKHDLPEDRVASMCAGLSADLKKEIRQYSYAALLYKELRCNFMHEYRVGARASVSDAARSVFKVGATDISYVYPVEDPGVPTQRRIHFPLDWIVEIAASVAKGIDNECKRQKKCVFEDLKLKTIKWWIDGM